MAGSPAASPAPAGPARQQEQPMLPANATPPTTSAAFHGPSATARAGTNPPFFGLLSALRAI